jgi:uncharacterized small protein (DUF1192 family)
MMASQPGAGRRNAQLPKNQNGMQIRNNPLYNNQNRMQIRNNPLYNNQNRMQIRNNPLYNNQNVLKAPQSYQKTGAGDAVMAELKKRFASRGNKPMLEAVGRLAPGLVPVPYQRGIRNFDQTKQILVNAMGRPFIVFIPAQMREQNKEILSDDRLRPSLLDMRFVRKSQSPGMAVFGDGYYNTKFFGTAPTPTPVISTAEINARCNEIRDRIARLAAELEQNGCV